MLTSNENERWSLTIVVMVWCLVSVGAARAAEAMLTKAGEPHPPDGATCVDPNVVLSWIPGPGATAHDIYFGTNLDDVNDGKGCTFKGRWLLDYNMFNPAGLALGQTYYWRIDEVQADGITIHTGDVWSFTTSVGNGLVKFKGTVTADEQYDEFVCYGSYYVPVSIDEILEDSKLALACMTIIEVCYDRPLQLQPGESVEVYGYHWRGPCLLQLCNRVRASGDSYYIIRQGVAQVRILKPTYGTWYYIARQGNPEDNTLGSFTPPIIEFEARGVPAGGSYKWTISPVATSEIEFPDEAVPHLLNAMKNCIPEAATTETVIPWWFPDYWPPSPVPPYPLPIDGYEKFWPPCFIAWSGGPWFAFEVSCEYTSPGGVTTTDVVHIGSRYYVGSRSFVNQGFYFEYLTGSIGETPGERILAIDPGKGVTAIGSLSSIACWKIAEALAIIGELLIDPIPWIQPSEPITSHVSLALAESNCTEPFSIVHRSFPDLPAPESELQRLGLNMGLKAIPLVETIEALRGTSDRLSYAKYINNDQATWLQRKKFAEYFKMYLELSQEWIESINAVIDELHATGDIFYSPEDIRKFAIDVMKNGLPDLEMEVLEAYGVGDSYIDEIKIEMFSYPPGELSGYLSTKLAEFSTRLHEGNQRWAEYYDKVTKYRPTIIPGDINGDGCVDILDLEILVDNWTECVDPADPNRTWTP